MCDKRMEVGCGVLWLTEKPAGIGVHLAPDRLLVSALVDGGAATQSGILAGDLITAIDGKPMDEMHRLDSISMLRGQPGIQVQVRINRQGEELDINITRDLSN